MEDIFSLLNINKGLLQGFHLQAERAVDHQTELTINRNIRSLRDIEERMMLDMPSNVSQQTIDDIVNKVYENAITQNKDWSIWSIREIRIVSYYLMKLQGNKDVYQYALNLIDSNWKDMFFNGLSFYCLDTWNLIEPDFRQLACNLLTKKLQNYNGSNKKYIAMKNHINLFENAGPIRMSALLCQKGQDVKDAPMYFCNRQSTIHQSYYSDVIIYFLDKKNITDLEYVEEILQIHRSERTKKLVFADLVFRLNDFGDEVERNQVCKLANRILGDITLTSTWAPFIGATDKDAYKLKKAKELVNLWLNKKIIESFFEVCVQDRARKAFWLKYVEYVSCFKIVGSANTRKLLQADSRVSSLFAPHFIETNSSTAKTSALVLFVKNKMIVEFSDTGALYVYNQDHEKVKLITSKKRYISKTSDLKETSMDNLIYSEDWGYSENYEEGKMRHSGYWQDRLECWMDEKIISSNKTGIAFFDTQDDNLFKAKPFPKVEFKPAIKTIAVPDHKQNVSSENIEYKKHAVTTTTEVTINPEDSKPNIPLSIITKKIIYETNIPFSIYSKWIANDKCRIVCNEKGYYLNVSRGKQYVHLRPLPEGCHPTGSIWIKKQNLSGWQKIVHSFSGLELPVGFIKEGGGGMLYKYDLSQTDSVMIKLI